MNVKNRTLFIADNLDIMRGMDSETIDLIYLDPPFNTKRQYKAPIGSPAEGAEFKDIWTDEDIKYGWYSEIAEGYPNLYQIVQTAGSTYDRSMMIYLMAMSIRLIEMKRILKPTGSIYLHCDPTASHYLKMVMDAVFEKENFRNEIVWHYYNGSSNSKKNFARKHDIILFYSGPKQNTFDDIAAREPYAEDSNWVKNPESYGEGYQANPHGKRMHDVWRIPSLNNMAKERTGYPTQKPLALLHRIIKTSSNEGNMVLDPFCGCATACIAAEQLKCQWIGIDIAAAAEDITKHRLLKEVRPEQPELWHDVNANVTVTKQVPIRTDLEKYQEELRQRELPHYRVHKNELYGKQEGFCKGCGEHFRIRNLTVDHKTPQALGGTDHIENLQLLCQACNSTKGTGTQEQLIERLKEQGVLR